MNEAQHQEINAKLDSLREQIGLSNRITAVETQLGRIISDIESEKGTRLRIHHDFETRLRFLEKSIWKAVGAVVILQIAVQVMLKIFVK
jgi:Zn-dependent M16 (insulinase) family peptidase